MTMNTDALGFLGLTLAITVGVASVIVAAAWSVLSMIAWVVSLFVATEDQLAGSHVGLIHRDEDHPLIFYGGGRSLRADRPGLGGTASASVKPFSSALWRHRPQE
jgi:hypothetical protein